MNKLLVVGGATLDTLHFDDRTITCPGGSGLYTALAARRCGALVSMFSPRPDPTSKNIKKVARHLSEWLGPLVPLEDLPRFEISYRGGKTEYLNAELGAEGRQTPEELPADLSKYDHVHVAAQKDAVTQLAFIQTCRQRGAKQISAGTYPEDVAKYPEAVRAMIEETEIFFMNKREAEGLFGSIDSACTKPGKALYITQGAQGACIIQGDIRTFIPAIPSTAVDPTGAGDTFCGATLAYLLQNKHPIMAARYAVPLAAEMITQVGATVLLSKEPPPEPPLDGRVQVDNGQVRKVAEKIITLPDASPFPFVGPGYIHVGHPRALEYFFAATLQQFSFWSRDNGRYGRPLIARIGGFERKGSDYLWEAYRRQVEIDPDFCSPERQAFLSHQELLGVFRADNGHDPMPALDLHLEMAHRYGRDMLALQLTPQAVLDKALESDQPLQTFLGLLDHIGGYKEDPLRKKSGLLALILNQRPEIFLPLRDDERVEPVIDYHLMRSCLRVGLVEVVDEPLYKKLQNRQIVSPAEEWAVRYPAYRAIEGVVKHSGKSTGAVDELFFQAREWCPEMSETDCHTCKLDPVCAHHNVLFQPVLRTSFY